MAPDSRARRYVTLAGDAEASQEIKRSQFLGFARRVTTEDAAREFVAELRKAHHEARHVCSAFVVGADRDVQRSSDDGEPAGTAGIPMLEAIIQRQTAPGETLLSDLCVAVVRYFGGIKLGASGLVGAYSSTTSLVLDDARLVSRERLRLATLDIDYADAGRVESALRAAGADVRGSEFTPTATRLTLAADDADPAWDELVARVAAITSSAGVVTPTGTAWADRPL